MPKKKNVLNEINEEDAEDITERSENMLRKYVKEER